MKERQLQPKYGLTPCVLIRGGACCLDVSQPSCLPACLLACLPACLVHQDFERHQLAVRQQQLAEVRAELDAATASGNAMRDALLAIHVALSPHSLSAALGMGNDFGTGYNLSLEEHEALKQRLMGCAAVPSCDAAAVASRVRELLAQVSCVMCKCNDMLGVAGCIHNPPLLAVSGNKRNRHQISTNPALNAC
jgi:hypothetical protein